MTIREGSRGRGVEGRKLTFRCLALADTRTGEIGRGLDVWMESKMDLSKGTSSVAGERERRSTYLWP